jgi:hypothetical protein
VSGALPVMLAASQALTIFGLVVLIAGFVMVFWLWWRFFRGPGEQ